MKYPTLILVLSLFVSVNAQQLEKHLWKNRVLLVISENETSDLLMRQLELLDKPKQLKERKLIIYQIHPKKHKVLNKDKSDWVKSSGLFDEYNAEGVEFKIVLIGLDGGIKLKQNDNVLTSEILFSTIDRMPMRQRELRDH
ncbi:DUF4174 domain-containing protein [Winogradskyella sp.]|uniref:DUF4174 domain-containing protein n=1 Tax=Winogradskyella sp. TaxID=1883156 RepID=UPI0026123DA0|nr:DUF4174 domain-containing protein [Winogradskyella sp.]